MSSKKPNKGKAKPEPKTKGAKSKAAAAEPVSAEVLNAATLDAKLNAAREAWRLVEEYRAKKKIEVKALADRVKASRDALELLLRNGTGAEQPHIALDQACKLQLKIDDLEAKQEACASRWKVKIEEAEQKFRECLFGEQLPLLLGAAPEEKSEAEVQQAAGGGVTSDGTVVLKDGRLLNVGMHVMVHGAGAHRPAVIREIDRDPECEPTHFPTVVLYDDTPDTPAHVLLHQCHPLEDEAPKAKGRGRKAAEKAGMQAAADIAKDEPAPDAKAPLPKGELALGDRVTLTSVDAELGVAGTVEALVTDRVGIIRQARVRWDSDGKLTGHPLEHLAKLGKKRATKAAPAKRGRGK